MEHIFALCLNFDIDMEDIFHSPKLLEASKYLVGPEIRHLPVISDFSFSPTRLPPIQKVCLTPIFHRAVSLCTVLDTDKQSGAWQQHRKS